MDGMLSLYWNNHKATFCHILATLREKERYTDATLACEGKFYPVHKLVLSTCSEYFELMFDNTPCKHPIIVLKDIKPDELEALLSYMYAGVVSVAQNDLARLIKAAELLQIKGLAVPDEPPVTEDNKRSISTRDGREHRGSPQSKRRRRGGGGGEENGPPSQAGSQPSISPPTSPRSSPYPLESESRTHPRTQSENQRTELRHESLEASTSHESSESDVKVMVDESLVKEELIETLDDSRSEGLDFMPVGSDSGMENPGGGGGDEHMLPNKYDQPGGGGIPGQAQQPLADAVAEALAGPSGMQGWLGVGDMASGFSSENYGGEGSQEIHGSPGQGSGPQAQQRKELVRYQWASLAVRSAIAAAAAASASSADNNKYRCSFCDYTSIARSNLENHMRTHNKFRCSFCNYTSIARTNLENHMRTHTGEKPFACWFCPYRSTQKGNLRTHIKNKH